MARTRDRIIALVIAITFFATTFVVSFGVIWQLTHKKETTTVDQSTLSDVQGNQVGMLQGTKLADFAPVEKVEKLQITDTSVGNGDEATPGANVVVDYTGAVAATGVIFQSSKDSGQPAPLSLNQVIDGWKEGIPGMKVGGTRRLLIPAVQAYGSNPPEGIPVDADLVFDVTLHSVTK